MYIGDRSFLTSHRSARGTCEAHAIKTLSVRRCNLRAQHMLDKLGHTLYFGIMDAIVFDERNDDLMVR